MAAGREFHVAVVTKRKVAHVFVLALAVGSRCWGAWRCLTLSSLGPPGSSSGY